MTIDEITKSETFTEKEVYLPFESVDAKQFWCRVRENGEWYNFVYVANMIHSAIVIPLHFNVCFFLYFVRNTIIIYLVLPPLSI